MGRKKIVITIDGPAGVGKSTVGRIVAKNLSYIYLETGAIYRALALKVLESGIPWNDECLLKKMVEGTDISVKVVNNESRVFLDGRDVTDVLRTEEIARLASDVSTLSVVRRFLLGIQRNVSSSGGVVAEGRDMGTVVFPDAELKIYLDADFKERVKRRYLELLGRGQDVDYVKLHDEMGRRDRQDRERVLAPLLPHPDAHIIDTTRMSVDEVVSVIMNLVNGYFAKGE
ncbi:MAG: (d)CMP kinase [Syntrophales bacterium]|nr:(d)CMP kinase [Syntrophales bacterium]